MTCSLDFFFARFTLHFSQTYKFDFLILCVGRYAVAKLPKFPHEAGPEVFHGQVVHSMDFSRMPHADADELIRGKRVVVVGSGKSGIDIVAQCAEANNGEMQCKESFLPYAKLFLCQQISQSNATERLRNFIHD
jgi:cation diffusion facilitator CzcD-associated flavoprotein CzcO